MLVVSLPLDVVSAVNFEVDAVVVVVVVGTAVYAVIPVGRGSSK